MRFFVATNLVVPLLFMAKVADEGFPKLCAKYSSLEGKENNFKMKRSFFAQGAQDVFLFHRATR